MLKIRRKHVFKNAVLQTMGILYIGRATQFATKLPSDKTQPDFAKQAVLLTHRMHRPRITCVSLAVRTLLLSIILRM